MSIRSYNKRPLVSGLSIALSSDCCCEDPPDEDQFESPCGCYDFWPHSLTVELRGLEDYFLPGSGKCNCPLDEYGPGFNQTVVLDFSGVVTVDDCDPGQQDFSRLIIFGEGVAANVNGNPFAAAVYRGTLQNGSCDEYGMEAALYSSFGACGITLAIDKASSSPGGPCEPWLQTTLECNSWYFRGAFDPTCSEAILPYGGGYLGGASFPDEDGQQTSGAWVAYR